MIRKLQILAVFSLILLGSCQSKSSEQSSTPEQNSPESTPAEQPIDPNEVVKNNSTADQPAPVKADGSAAAITFDAKEKNFGTINEGEQVEITYKFTNTGGSDLVISQCQAGCGCTIPEWPKDPIKPGKSGVIKAKFDSNGRAGHNEKHVTVFTNALENTVDLVFTGEVKPKY